MIEKTLSQKCQLFSVVEESFDFRIPLSAINFVMGEPMISDSPAHAICTMRRTDKTFLEGDRLRSSIMEGEI